jgi:hypothetical protein
VRDVCAEDDGVTFAKLEALAPDGEFQATTRDDQVLAGAWLMRLGVFAALPG